MTFSSTVTHSSNSTPGVSFEVRRIGFGKRTEIDFSTLALRQRLRELEAEYPPMSEREKPLAEQVEIARRKSLAVPPEEFEAVLQNEVMPLAQELAAAIPPDVLAKRAVLDEEYQLVEAKLRAHWIRAGLLGIAGGDVDGMTAEQLLEYGPPALAEEIYSAISGDGQLRGPERKNSPLPITSSGAADGPAKNSTAPSVEAALAAGG